MASKLTAVKVRSLVKPGSYGDGAGLYLQVRGPEQRSWVFRFKMAGRSRLMGLGALADVSLAEAREKAAAARKLARSGTDPLDARTAVRAGLAAKQGLITFREVADAYQAAHAPGWRNAKHRQQWANTLSTYTFPVMGHLPVASVGVGEVLRVVEPLWTAKPETAARVRGRIETILDYATAKGLRTGDNPARWKGHLSMALPARAKVRRVKHHAALPWAEAGAFMAALRAQPGTASLALRFAILTAARTGEVIGATWAEVDRRAGVWTVPAERMKAGREHRVPLSEPALALLRTMAVAGAETRGFIFPGQRFGRGLSNMAMLTVLRRMGRADVTAHGFRSAFRDWAGETTGYAAEVIEAALAHTVGNKTVAAYARGDLFEKRRRLMAEWAAHCEGAAPAMGEVVPLRASR